MTTYGDWPTPFRFPLDYLLGRETEPGNAGPVAEQLLRDFARIAAKDQDTVADFARMLAEKGKPRKGDK